MEIIFVEIQLLVNKMFVPGREWSRRASADVTSVSDVHAMYYWCWQTFCNISSPLHTVHKTLTIKIQISTLINNIPVTVPLPLLSLSFFTQMQLSGEDQKPPEVIKVSYRAREVRSSPGAPLPDASPGADAATGEERRDGRKH